MEGITVMMMSFICFSETKMRDDGRGELRVGSGEGKIRGGVLVFQLTVLST